MWWCFWLCTVITLVQLSWWWWYLITKGCLTLWHPIDCSPPGSSVHGTLQARILEWVAMPSSRGSSQTRDRTCIPWAAVRVFTAEPPGKPFNYHSFMKVKVKVAWLCLTLCDPMDYIVHGILQARILEWVSLSLLQGIFPTQGLNPGLPHYRQILYKLSHKGSLRMLEWVAYLFFSISSQPRNQTQVSCIAGRFFINWAIREAHHSFIVNIYIDFSVIHCLKKKLVQNLVDF